MSNLVVRNRITIILQTVINCILEEFREYSASSRDLGDKFEQLMAQYFLTDPIPVDWTQFSLAQPQQQIKLIKKLDLGHLSAGLCLSQDQTAYWGRHVGFLGEAVARCLLCPVHQQSKANMATGYLEITNNPQEYKAILFCPLDPIFMI